MKQFQYTITDSVGIHARPAGLLVKAARAFQSSITVEKDGKTAAATKLMALMGMGIKQGNTVTVTVEGADEEEAAAAMEKFRPPPPWRSFSRRICERGPHKRKRPAETKIRRALLPPREGCGRM